MLQPVIKEWFLLKKQRLDVAVQKICNLWVDNYCWVSLNTNISQNFIIYSSIYKLAYRYYD